MSVYPDPDHIEHVGQLLEFQTALQLQEAANIQLLLQIKHLREGSDYAANQIEKLTKESADFKLKHDYQVRRADLSEKRVFELLEELKDVASVNAELRAELEETVKQLNDKLDELGLIKHILVEVGNGRFQKVDKPVPQDFNKIPSTFIPSLPERMNQTDLDKAPTTFPSTYNFRKDDVYDMAGNNLGPLYKLEKAQAVPAGPSPMSSDRDDIWPSKQAGPRF